MAKAATARQDKPAAAAPQTAGEHVIKQALTEAAAATAPAGVKPIAPLLASEIWARETGVKFNTWEVVPQAKTPVENVLRRDFWNNVAQRMKPGDKVIVYPRDGAYYAELIVWDAGQNWADVEPVIARPRPQLAAAPGIVSDFEIGTDPIDGVVVKRKSDGSKVRGNFANHEDARRWLIEYQQSLRR